MEHFGRLPLGSLVRRACIPALLFALSCGKDGVGPPPPVASVNVQTSATELMVGKTLTLSAQTLSASGEVLSGRSISWTSSDTAIAVVDQAGTVSARAQGSVRITATSEGQTGGVQLVIIPPPVASVRVTAAQSSVTVAGTVQLTAEALDSVGKVISGKSFAWSASPEGMVTVSQTGLVTGVNRGAVTVNASVDGKTGSVPLSVLPEPVTITATNPAILVAGQTVTITGTGFSTATAEDTLMVDGKRAVVSSATRTQIVATVPTGYACLPTHGVTVSVTVEDRKAVTTRPLRVGSLREMAVGQSAILSDAAELACTELPGGTGEYLAVVINKDDSFSQSPVSFRLTGKSLAGLTSSATDNTTVRAQQNRTETSLRASSQPRATPASSLAQTAPTVGETRQFYVPGWFGYPICSIGSAPGGPSQITARAVYVGTRAIVWEDVASPKAGQVDNVLIRVGQDMDQYYPIASEYFGDPLSTDDVTDNDDHFGIIFSPKVGTMTDGGYMHWRHLNGFYSPCDFAPYQPSLNGTGGNYSNLGEYIYESTADHADWRPEFSVAHTLQHLITAELRFLNPSPAPAYTATSDRLEEAMALANQELFARTIITPTPWKSNAGFQNCCSVSTSAFGINDLNALKSLTTFSLTGGGMGLYSRDPYGVQWSFIRWYVDRFAADEKQALKLLSRPGLSLQSLSDLVVLPKEVLLGNWAMALYVDDLPQFAQNADMNIPTWNLHSIFAEINKTSTPTYFLNPTVLPFGDFSSDRSLVPTAVTLYLLSEAGAGAHTFSLLGGAGSGAVHPDIKMGIARIK